MLIRFFSFWEINKIGCNIFDRKGELVHIIDFSIDDAKRTYKELGDAIESYNLIEKSLKEDYENTRT